MSLFSWLKSKSKSDGAYLLLPKPSEGDTSTASANMLVEAELTSQDRRKRGNNHHYTPEVRAKIAKYATEHGNKATVATFSRELKHDVSESTVRNFKSAYMRKLQTEKDPSGIVALPHGSVGRPLLLGKDLDAKVAEYVKALRIAGGIVNRSILIAAARGIVMHESPARLKEHGGSIELGIKWAESFFTRHNYVKRKSTKAAKKLPPDFAELKLAFLERIRSEVRDNGIPPQLIFNWDQTGSKLMPVGEWTMAGEGSKQVPVVGKDDKREITVLLTITSSGVLLPPQVIYQGKTPGCHIKITFPSNWNITHSDTHWSTESTMVEFLDSVIVPYVNSTRAQLELPEDQVALAIFDVFAAHRCSSVLTKLADNHIHQIFVPACCTSELQPLDLSVNSEFKALMKANFSRWYAGEVSDALDRNQSLSEIKVDLHTSVIKPLHANWLITAITTLKEKTSSIVKGFDMAGISEYTK